MVKKATSWALELSTSERFWFATLGLEIREYLGESLPILQQPVPRRRGNESA